MNIINKIISFITIHRKKLLDGIKTGYPKDEYYYKYLRDLQRAKEDIERLQGTQKKQNKAF